MKAYEFSPADEQVVITHYPFEHAKKIAAAIGCSEKTVHRKAKKLRIKKLYTPRFVDFETVRKIAIMYTCNPNEYGIQTKISVELNIRFELVNSVIRNIKINDCAQKIIERSTVL